MAEDDTLRVLVELNDLELECLTSLSLCAILLNEVLRCSEALNVLLECYDSTLLEHLGDLTLMDRTYAVFSLEYIPRIILELLVAKAETTVLLVDIQNDNVDLSTYLCEL